MKRPKYRTFKKQKDLIKQAIANTITRQLAKTERVKMIKRMIEDIQCGMKEKDWLAWAQRQVRR